MKSKGILPMPVFTRGRGEKKREHLVSFKQLLSYALHTKEQC